VKEENTISQKSQTCTAPTVKGYLGTRDHARESREGRAVKIGQSGGGHRIETGDTREKEVEMLGLFLSPPFFVFFLFVCLLRLGVAGRANGLDHHVAGGREVPRRELGVERLPLGSRNLKGGAPTRHTFHNHIIKRILQVLGEFPHSPKVPSGSTVLDLNSGGRHFPGSAEGERGQRGSLQHSANPPRSSGGGGRVFKY